MPAPTCCHAPTHDSMAKRDSKPNDSKPKPSPIRRATFTAKWIVPSAGLILMPKCPMCLAAYIAFATGLGVSFETADWLRSTLIWSCIASLTLFTALTLRRLIRRRMVS